MTKIFDDQSASKTTTTSFSAAATMLHTHTHAHTATVNRPSSRSSIEWFPLPFVSQSLSVERRRAVLDFHRLSRNRRKPQTPGKYMILYTHVVVFSSRRGIIPGLIRFSNVACEPILFSAVSRGSSSTGWPRNRLRNSPTTLLPRFERLDELRSRIP